MRFKVIKTSDSCNVKPKDIEINTLQELMEWINKQDHEVIISEGCLEIYDDYRE